MSSPQPQALPIRPGAPSPDQGGDAEEGYSHDVARIRILWLGVPPPEGWEAINRENLGKLQENGRYMNGCTDRVLELMRHIPYFTSNSPDLLVESYTVDHLGNFTGWFIRSPETDGEKEAARKRIERASKDYDQLVPPHMRSGYPTEHVGDLELEPEIDDWAVDDSTAESWKLSRIYRIQTFFDLWKREFKVESAPIMTMKPAES
ncbi:hypothetical protein PG988_004633 [Apiospora saccharicola]